MVIMRLKILGWMVGLFVLFGCQQPILYFKNPIFYEPMYGHRVYYDKVITPVAMVHFHDDEVLPAKCKVLSDIGYQIVMECRDPPYRTTPERTRYYRFTSTGKEKLSKDYCRIREEIFDEDEWKEGRPSIIFQSSIRVPEEESCGQIAPQHLLDSYKI